MTHCEFSGDTDFLREEAKIAGEGSRQARGATKHRSSVPHKRSVRPTIWQRWGWCASQLSSGLAGSASILQMEKPRPGGHINPATFALLSDGPGIPQPAGLPPESGSF